MTRVLAIEDNDAKWERVETVVRRALGPDAEITRVRDLYEGEQLVEEPGWDLLVLDISLDIRAGGARGGRGSHDFTGGLKIAGRMFYNECEVPTVIITGFDAFPTGGAAQEADVIMGLEDVERQARQFLGEHLLGTLRFGSHGWEDELVGMLARISA